MCGGFKRLLEPKGWRGWGPWSRGGNRDREGRTNGEPGADTWTTAEMTATTVQVRGGGGQERHQQQVSSAGAGGGYRAGGADEEESADKSAKWSGVELEGLATETETTTAGGAGGDRATRTATTEGTQDSSAGGIAADKADDGGDGVT